MVDFSKYVKKIVPEEPVDPQPVDLAATVNQVSPEDEPQDFSKFVEGPDVPLDKTVYHTVARTSTPAGEAEMQQIEAKTGIPQDVIRSNMDASRTRAEYSTLVLDAQGSPKLLGFLQDPKQLAAVREDVPALSQVEATLAHEIKTNVIETFEDIPAGFKRGQEVVEAGQLYSELSNLIATGGDQTEVLERIAVFEEKEKAVASEGGFLEAAAEMLPIMGHTILAGQAEGLKYATVGAAGSLITGGVTAPAAAAIMYPTGVVVGAMEQMFSIERGNALKEFMDLEDETGAPMDPQVANMAAIGVGAINAGLEYVGLKNIPGADKLLGKFTKDAVKKALKDPSVRRALTKVALRYGKGIAVETITEASQEIINILGGAIAKKVSDQEFAPEDIFSPENISRVLEAGEMAFKATTVLGAPGSGISAVREVRKTEKMIQDQQAFVEHHTAVDEAVQATDTALNNPVMMERFLKDTMGLKDQDAFIDSDVLLEMEQNTPEILDEIIQEMGASKDKILEAAEQGRPVRLNMGAYHARLSPEAKTALFNGLKSTPGSYSAAQIEAGMAQAADNFEDNYEGFIVESEAINTEITRIESESLAAGADSRVAAQTAQIAARLAISTAENTADGNAAELLRKIQFGPMGVQGEAVSYDQSGQLVQDENFQRFMEGSQLTEPVFHGTEAQVEDSFVFDASKIGEQGRSEGAGFYFTPDKGIATGYAGESGNVIEAYVNMKQPMPYAQVGFDQGTMEQILARAAELESIQGEMDIEDGFLSNFGDARYEGLDSVIDSAAAMMDEDKAIDQMGGLVGSGVDPMVVNQAVNDVTGFDGVISEGFSDQGGPQIITVFFPNQIKSAQNFGAFDPSSPDIYQQTDTAAEPPAREAFYSQLAQSIQGVKQNKAPGQQWAAMINKMPVKQEEVEWSGIIEFLKGKKSVTRQEVIDYLEQNQVVIEEVVKGGESQTERAIAHEEILLFVTDEVGEGFYFDDRGPEGYSYLIEQDEDGNLGEVMYEGYADEIAESLNLEIETLEDVTKFAQYQLPGGENYKEILLTLPTGVAERQKLAAIDRERPLTDAEQKRYDELQKETAGEQFFKSSHFDEPNILAHVRMSERTVDGKRVLHIEEVQSDWHQAGRKKGYKDTVYAITHMTDQGIQTEEFKTRKEAQDFLPTVDASTAGIREISKGETPDAPFKKSWPLLAMKRMVRYAAENGFDVVAWTQGAEQAARYDLSKQIDKLDVRKNDQGDYVLQMEKDGQSLAGYKVKSNSELENYVGKDLAVRIVEDSRIEAGGKFVSYSGLDLKVGGKGMKAFYDRILPNEVNKFFNKKAWGKARVGEMEIETAKQIKTEADDFMGPEFGRKTETHKLHALPITPEIKTKALTEGFPLFQGAKGNVQIFDDRYLINLFENANESTPFHELAHTFLYEMQTVIDRGAANDQMIADMTVVGSWMDTLNDPDLFQEQYKKYTPKEFEGCALVDLTTLERAQALGVVKHEYFARGFEQYLMEGRAPAPELIPAFRRFARWLKVVYKHVSQLDVNLTAPIRGVFDRMLQSEFEVEGSMNDMGLQALTKKEMDALGMLPEDRDYLKRLHQDAQTAAEVKLTAARVGGVRRLRPEWIEKADDSIQRDPLNATVNRLQKGQGIDRKVAVELWTKAAIDRMPVGLKKIFKVGGMNPDEVAYEEGYASAENLLDALETWVTESMQKRRYVAQRQKEYQDSLNPDDFLVDTAEFAEYLGIIGNYTAGKMGDQAQLDIKLQGTKGSKTVLARSAFKKYAKTIIRDMPIRDAVRSDLFTGAMKKASQGEAAAIKRGDWGTAQRANEQMRLNFEMAQESRKIRLEKEKIERMAKRLKKAKPDKVEASYLGAALSLAQRFGLVQLNDAFIPILQKAGDIKSLMVDKADIMGPDEFGFSTELMSGTVPFDYRDLNADELNEVAVLIKALVKRGRDKINPKLTSLGITLDEAKENVLPAIGSLKSKTKWAKRGKSFFGVDPRAWLRSITDFSRRIYADTYHLWAMIRVLDGFVYYDKGNKRGPLETYMRDNLEKAYGTKTTLTAKFEPKVKAAIAKLYNRAGNRKKMAVWLTDIIPVPVPRTLVNDGRGWDFEAVAAVALNIGNESNLSRLRDGYGWTDEQINSIVGLLTEKEWDAVQELWDIFEEMRPGMYAAAERIHGVEPPTIEHRAFRTPAGKVMRGGYAPAVYDFSSVRAAELNENQLLRQTADAGHQRPSVNARATKSRATTAGGMPIRLDLSGVAQQFDYNLHYTAFAETVRDLSRLLGDQEVADAIREKVGKEWLPAMRIILANVANPGVNGTTDTISNLFKWFGVQASKFVLGLNRGVGVKQVFSVPAIYTEGGSWFGGLPKVLTNPRKAYNDMLEESPLMKLRMDGSQIDREVSRMRRDLSKQNKLSAQAWEVVDEALFIFIRLFDGIAVLPGYYGTKKRMERKFGPGQRAIRETEKILTDTQPISRQMDMSRVQLNRTGLARLVTMFTGFTMKFENRNRVYVRGFLEGKISFRRFATQVVLERLMPPLLMNLLFTMGYGDEPDAEAMLWDAVLYQVCGFPILRELAVGVSNAVRHGYDGEFRGFSPIGTPLLAVGEAIYFNMNTVSRWLFGDATDKEGGMALLEGLLALKGVPAVKAYKDIEEGIRQMERSDGFDAFFKAAIKPNPKERE